MASLLVLIVCKQPSVDLFQRVQFIQQDADLLLEQFCDLTG